ncbi:RNA polymerase sigma factor [Pelagibacterium sp.]|uniref:RNA polymerase sigma factor n=1 Tax=Pelagibacterium sp. TaxID=1967288 RepID=UPI003A933E79
MTSLPFEQRLYPVRERLMRYAFALTRDRDEARDLFQETMVRAMSAGDVPAADPAFRAWLFKIIRNLWIDRSRSHARRVRLYDQFANGEAGEAGEATTERNYAVREAFAFLSVEHQEVLALVDIAGFSYEETGELLSIPRGTVMSRVSRARQSLFQLLSGDAVVPLSRPRRSL